jgi:rare lipoprotein A
VTAGGRSEAKGGIGGRCFQGWQRTATDVAGSALLRAALCGLLAACVAPPEAGPAPSALTPAGAAAAAEASPTAVPIRPVPAPAAVEGSASGGVPSTGGAGPGDTAPPSPAAPVAPSGVASAIGSAAPAKPAPGPGGPGPRVATAALEGRVATGSAGPDAAAGRTERGLASWYGHRFHGRPTASGEPFDADAFTAAHRTLPFGTRVRVRHVANGRAVVVRINDRGPARRDRLIDLSLAAARALGLHGLARVEVTPLDGGETDRGR